MKKIVFLIFCNLVFSVNYSQSKKKIDSINSISTVFIQENASTLANNYLLNSKIARKLNYKFGEAESYSKLSLIYYYQGKYEKDVQYSLKAIQIFDAIGNKEKLAFEYGELGYRMKRRNLPKAVYFMQKGKNISELNNFEKPLLSIYNNYGYLKELQNENDSAIYYYDKCLKIKEKIKDSVGIPYSLNYKALIYIKTGDFNRAKPLLERALAIRLNLNDKTGIAENYFYNGDLYFSQKRYKIAVDNYTKSLNIAQKNNYVNLIQTCYKAISECYEKLNNSKSALLNYKKHKQYNDSLINVTTNSKIAELDIKFQTQAKENQIIESKAETSKKNNQLIISSILAIGFLIIGYLFYRQQKQKNQQQAQESQLKSAIAEIETQNKLQNQRLSISRDLHDNIGAQLTFIISSVDNVKYGFDITNEKLDNKLTNISSFAKDTIIELRDTIWAMNSNEITYEDLEARISNYIEKAKLSQENCSFLFKIDKNLKNQKLTSVEGMNIYRTIQEAVNNALKYAKASKVVIDVVKTANQTKITISDNGIGFNTNEMSLGNGLRNMKKRIDEINGKFNLTSSNNGTKIEILI